MSLNNLYIVIAICLVVLTAAFGYALYYLADDLKELKKVIVNINSISTSINLAQNELKLGFLTLLGNFLKTKRGK